jgi:hypothetical protein
MTGSAIGGEPVPARSATPGDATSVAVHPQAPGWVWYAAARQPLPTVEPTATVGATPSAEGTATATPSPTAPTATPAPDPAERFADLRTPGGPAETLLPAGQQDQVDSPLHRRWWDSFGPASFTNPEWEWVNKAQLWDAVVERVWADAVERYGDRLYDRPGTVWPRSDTSAYAVGAWSSHMESGGYGHVGLARVGLHPSDPEQRRPDLGVYWFQVAVDEVEPERFAGELVMAAVLVLLALAVGLGQATAAAAADGGAPPPDQAGGAPPPDQDPGLGPACGPNSPAGNPSA